MNPMQTQYTTLLFPREGRVTVGSKPKKQYLPWTSISCRKQLKGAPG